MADIFQREVGEFGGSFTADMTRLTFPALVREGGSEIGLLMQNVGINYQQNVQRLYELGSNRIYYVAGRTAGNAAIGRVIGPAVLTRAFYETYGDVCRAGSNVMQLSMQAGCGSGAGSTTGETLAIVLRFVVLLATSWNLAAADMIINEGGQMLFSSLEYQN